MPPRCTLIDPASSSQRPTKDKAIGPHDVPKKVVLPQQWGVRCYTVSISSKVSLGVGLIHYESTNTPPGKNDDQHLSLVPADYASSSDSDAGMTVVDQAWRGDADSDAESIDSEQEDPLK